MTPPAIRMIPPLPRCFDPPLKNGDSTAAKAESTTGIKFVNRAAPTQSARGHTAEREIARRGVPSHLGLSVVSFFS